MKVMKFLLSVLILIFSSCTPGSSDAELKNMMNKADTEEIPSRKFVDTSQETILSDYEVGSCDNLLVEIVNERRGMISPPGKILEIRILKNGIAEFDDYDNSNKIFRREIKIPKIQFDKLTDLLNSRTAFLKSEYTANNICMDTVVNKTIRFCPGIRQKKEVLIKECGPENADKGEVLPSGIVNLFETIDAVRKTPSP